MADPIQKDLTEENLDERYVLKGDPEDALRQFLAVKPEDQEPDPETDPEATKRS